MFWMICAGLAGIVGLAIAAPLLRRGAAPSDSAAAYDLRIYRDQLREIGRDQERGLLDPADAERLRVEIGRKVLAADRALSRMPASHQTRGGFAALLVLGLLLVSALGLYLYLGHPDRPDEPLARRLAQAQEIYDSRPSQAEAEARATAPARPAPDADYLALIEQLRQAVARNPQDIRGHELLAQHEERLGNLVAARLAQARLIELKGAEASAADWARLAALTIEAAGGLITREGEAAIAQALQHDARNPQARFMSGLLQLQNGRPDRAFPIWAALLAEGPADAPWIAPIRAAIPDLAWLAGQPNYTPPEPAALPGPDAQAMAAAKDMTPEQRQQMVEGMVKNLEDRLATQGGTPEEWARLISSLMVLGQADHARDILAEARRLFATDTAGLARIDSAAEQAGLK